MRRDILCLLRSKGRTDSVWEPVYMEERHTLRRTSGEWGTVSPFPATSLSISITQGALEIPVSTKPSTGVQPPKGWS